MDIEHFITYLHDLANNVGDVLGDIDDTTLAQLRSLAALLYAAIDEEEHERAQEQAQTE